MIDIGPKFYLASPTTLAMIFRSKVTDLESGGGVVVVGGGIKIGLFLHTTSFQFFLSDVLGQEPTITPHGIFFFSRKYHKKSNDHSRCYCVQAPGCKSQVVVNIINSCTCSRKMRFPSVIYLVLSVRLPDLSFYVLQMSAVTDNESKHS